MKGSYFGFEAEISFSFLKQDKWVKVPDSKISEDGFVYREDGNEYYCRFRPAEIAGVTDYEMGYIARDCTQMRMELSLLHEEDYFHLIPCNIYGDNNASQVHEGEFPLLTRQSSEDKFRSPRWEFRADRAAMPVSGLACRAGAVGISIAPYSDQVEGGRRNTPDGEHCDYIHNGVYAQLPHSVGVSLGYTNDPVTFTNKRTPTESTREMARTALAKGSLYFMRSDKEGKGRLRLHDIIRMEYHKRHVRAEYKKSPQQAAAGLVDAFVHVNWNDTDKEYTNLQCQVPDNSELKPWRNVVEIGWTGGAILAYPLVLSRYVEGAVLPDTFQSARSGEEIIERIVSGYNEASGLFYDLMTPRPGSTSLVNGWWTDFGLVRDCHCAYNVGSAVHYILKTIMFCRRVGKECPESWLNACRKVIDTVLELQREDGAFGYTYSTKEKKVLDWNGFAGCWFAPSAMYLYRLTAQEKYLEGARKALRYYHKWVEALQCSGAPMDTWKSVDQEGNLAFIRGCRLVHEYTGDAEFLEYLKQGAEYEYLWRYGYQTRPENRPLINGWNSCGGSVTSVSNPHIHPMGIIVDADLSYLAEATGDIYHQMRADDSTSWLLQTLELYPGETGYGQYGVLSERWCPSDGLTVEQYSDGQIYSSWFSYNLWAASNALEAVCAKSLDLSI